MTSTVIHTLPTMGYERSSLPATSGPASAASVWRRQGTVQAVVALSWSVAVSASFLAVGVIGMFAHDLPPIHLKSLADLATAEELPMIETSMAELLTQAANEDPVAVEETILPIEIPEAIETPPENLDLPEIAEAMTLEDVFAIPTAPKIEDALRPVDPVVKPQPAPTPPRPRTPVASTTRSTTTQAGTAGGTGNSGSGGRGTYPAPPYPSFARSAGMQGTVRLSISVGPSGAVDGVSIIGSTGFSALDEHAAAWVRRNWRWPGGSAKRYTLPLTFKLR